jgi:hypothetical protein
MLDKGNCPALPRHRRQTTHYKRFYVELGIAGLLRIARTKALTVRGCLVCGNRGFRGTLPDARNIVSRSFGCHIKIADRIVATGDLPMDWYWTWGGECFGYRLHDRLFAYHGLQAGQFHGDEVYGADGGYLGQVKRENRLITDLSKKPLTKLSFVPATSTPCDLYPNRVVLPGMPVMRISPHLTTSDERRTGVSARRTSGRKSHPGDDARERHPARAGCR